MAKFEESLKLQTNLSINIMSQLVQVQTELKKVSHRTPKPPNPRLAISQTSKHNTGSVFTSHCTPDRNHLVNTFGKVGTGKASDPNLSGSCANELKYSSGSLLQEIKENVNPNLPKGCSIQPSMRSEISPSSYGDLISVMKPAFSSKRETLKKVTGVPKGTGTGKLGFKTPTKKGDQKINLVKFDNNIIRPKMDRKTLPKPVSKSKSKSKSKSQTRDQKNIQRVNKIRRRSVSKTRKASKDSGMKTPKKTNTLIRKKSREISTKKDHAPQKPATKKINLLPSSKRITISCMSADLADPSLTTSEDPNLPIFHCPNRNKLVLASTSKDRVTKQLLSSYGSSKGYNLSNSRGKASTPVSNNTNLVNDSMTAATMNDQNFLAQQYWKVIFFFY